MKLTDDSKMPFGMHKGKKLSSVPVRYLHWLYFNAEDCDDIKEYIFENLEALKQEDTDLIWK